MEKILGTVQTENIQVTAKAYSIDLKILPGTNIYILEILHSKFKATLKAD